MNRESEIRATIDDVTQRRDAALTEIQNLAARLESSDGDEGVEQRRDEFNQAVTRMDGDIERLEQKLGRMRVLTSYAGDEHRLEAGSTQPVPERSQERRRTALRAARAVLPFDHRISPA
jgi:hypothetical protein